MKNGPWLRADMKAHIEPNPIPMIKLEVEDERTTHIIKVKTQIKPSSEVSETYNINMNKFNGG